MTAPNGATVEEREQVRVRVADPEEAQLRARIAGAWKSGDLDTAHDLMGRLVSKTKAPTESAIDTLWRPIGLDALIDVPPPRRWLLRHPTKNWEPCDPAFGDGMLPLGKAGVLSAEGGAGKTTLLVQLAICVITGRPFLGHFAVGDEARGGRCLLALAEEDADEVHRKSYDTVRSLSLTTAEKDLVARQLVILPLAGVPVALLRRADFGALVETPELLALRRRLHDDAGARWALVGLDPMSRFCGPDTEKDNEAATRTVQAMESLVAAPGSPTVLCDAHSSKMSRRAGTVDTRGVTAITDGLRWEGTLRVEDADVFFLQRKSNYSRPMPESQEIRLVRGAEGMLRAATAVEIQSRETAELAQVAAGLDVDVARVVAALSKAGQASSIDSIAGLAGMKLARGRVAVRTSIDRGAIVKGGTKRDPVFTACVGVPPRTPRGTSDVPAGGPRDVDRPRYDVRDVEGRRRDVGTSRHWQEERDADG